MAHIQIDLAQMPQFFGHIEEICRSFCNNQAAIERAFDAVQATWRDKNTVTTGVRLEDTARGIAKFYDSLNEAVDYILRVCNNRADYVDVDRLHRPQIEPFTVNISEINIMEDTVINTNRDALEEFRQALDKYTQSIVDNVESLRKLYYNIGDSWRDEQYEKFGDSLSAFSTQMQGQVDVLDAIEAFLRGKIEILRRSDI